MQIFKNQNFKRDQTTYLKIYFNVYTMENLLSVCSENNYTVVNENLKTDDHMSETMNLFHESIKHPDRVTIISKQPDISYLKKYIDDYNSEVSGVPSIRKDYTKFMYMLIFNGTFFAWDGDDNIKKWRCFFSKFTDEKDFCTICYETCNDDANNIVTCHTCYEWICNSCMNKLTVNKCPHCKSFDSLSV